MSHQQFQNESLLTVPIQDDEIFELLERLAATEEMFKAPVSTIRDVAELTEASPNLIARILGEMRGPGEFEKLTKRVEILEKLHLPEEELVIAESKTDSEKESERMFTIAVFGFAILFTVVLVILAQFGRWFHGA